MAARKVINTRAQPAKARTVEQQAADFTAEGAPPPGKVATAPPRTVAPSSNAGRPDPKAVTPARRKQRRQA